MLPLVTFIIYTLVMSFAHNVWFDDRRQTLTIDFRYSSHYMVAAGIMGGMGRKIAFKPFNPPVREVPYERSYFHPSPNFHTYLLENFHSLYPPICDTKRIANFIASNSCPPNLCIESGL